MIEKINFLRQLLTTAFAFFGASLAWFINGISSQKPIGLIYASMFAAIILIGVILLLVLEIYTRYKKMEE